MNRKIYFLLFLSIFIVISFFFSRNALAEVYLGISPSVIPVVIKPGDSVQKQITIENKSSQDISLNITFMPLKQSDKENGEVSYSVNKDEFLKNDPGIFEKIKILDKDTPVKTVKLAPKQAKTLTLNISLPEDEKASEYYFSVVFVYNNNKDNQTTDNKDATAKSFVNSAIATNILLSIDKEKITPQAVIADFSSPFILENGPTNFNLKIQNTGNHFIKTNGAIIVKNMFGQSIGKINIPDSYVLAESSKTITLLWTEKFILGPYTSYLTLNISDSSVFGKVSYFVGLPKTLFLGIIALIILAYIIIKKVKSRIA